METLPSSSDNTQPQTGAQAMGLPNKETFKNDLQNEWRQTLEEGKSALWDLGNSLVVDARAFWNIFKTT